jgi:hypothetical protein
LSSEAKAAFKICIDTVLFLVSRTLFINGNGTCTVPYQDPPSEIQETGQRELFPVKHFINLSRIAGDSMVRPTLYEKYQFSAVYFSGE